MLAVVTTRAPTTARAWLASQGADARIEYLDYDWTLNDLAVGR